MMNPVLVRFFRIAEILFWWLSGAITLIGAFGMLITGGYAVFAEFASIKDVLKQEIFYGIICFELFQMARIRIMGESHKQIIYHFVFMATLTFGREIFLIHNLSIWIVAGFAVLLMVYIVFYAWSHGQSIWPSSDKTGLERPVERF